MFHRLHSTSQRAPLARDDGEAVASLLTVLSLNINKWVDLGGLDSILKETKSHLVVLQEVFSYNAVSATFGYTLTAFTLRQSPGTSSWPLCFACLPLSRKSSLGESSW